MVYNISSAVNLQEQRIETFIKVGLKIFTIYKFFPCVEIKFNLSVFDKDARSAYQNKSALCTFQRKHREDIDC